MEFPAILIHKNLSSDSTSLMRKSKRSLEKLNPVAAREGRDTRANRVMPCFRAIEKRRKIKVKTTLLDRASQHMWRLGSIKVALLTCSWLVLALECFNGSPASCSHILRQASKTFCVTMHLHLCDINKRTRLWCLITASARDILIRSL